MKQTLIKNATIVNEGRTFRGSVLLEDERIKEVMDGIPHSQTFDVEIDASGLHLFPGLIDDQVHFREPGLTHKGDIATESKAAIAGGVTSFMEMPNTNPQTTTHEELVKKFASAEGRSYGNYSFYFGATNENLEAVKSVDTSLACGVKIFMGSSTGNMLVDQPDVLAAIFKESPLLIATHCEYEPIVRANSEAYRKQFGEDVPISAHPLIRSTEACYASSSRAAELADKTGANLHILHISTAKELELFSAGPIEGKKITAEACTHHLWFSDKDYETKGTHIKWNPAVKTADDRAGIRAGLMADKIDILATDHAPHTLEEKSNKYFSAPSGGPLIQHNLQALIDLYRNDVLSLEQMVQKAVHNVAIRYQLKDRGYLKPGYFADFVLVDLNKSEMVSKNNLHYKCGWSPFEGHRFSSSIAQTWLSGRCVYNQGSFAPPSGRQLTFNR